jgi:hypothetical protein
MWIYSEINVIMDKTPIIPDKATALEIIGHMHDSGSTV